MSGTSSNDPPPDKGDSPAASPFAKRPSSARAAKRGLGALRYRNYRFFLIGQSASVTGLWMQSLALSWLVVTTLGGSPVDLGLVNALNFGPTLVFGLLAGALADRVNKRDLVNICQIIALTLAAGQAFLIVTDRATINQVFLFAFILGLSNAFNMPARQAMTSELVGRPDVLNAIALNSAVFNAGRVIGPSIAGILVAAFGPAICFAVNAVSYLIAFIMFRQIKLTPTIRTAAEPLGQRLREGLAFVRTTESILLPIVLVGFVATFAMNFNVWLPLLARDEFDIGAKGFGLLTASLGVGSLIGALNLAYFSDRPRREVMFGLAAALGVIEIVVAAMSAIPMSVVFALPVLALCGFCMSTAMATANTIVQTAAPDELRGRIMSVYMTVFSGTVPIGALLTGFMAETLGTPIAVGGGGAIATVSALGIWGVQRRLDAKHIAAAVHGDGSVTEDVPVPVSNRAGNPQVIESTPAPRTNASTYAPIEATED